MSTTNEPTPDSFQWEVQPAAARWVTRQVESLVDRNPAVRRLADVLRDQTGTRLVDWVDHLACTGDDEQLPHQLAEIGYVADLPGAGATSPGDGQAWHHPLGMFPTVLLGARQAGLAICVDSLDACLALLPPAIGISEVRPESAEGECGGPFRRAMLNSENDISENDVALWAVERHGYQGFTCPQTDSEQIEAAARHLDAFRGRQRDFTQPEDGFAHASRLIVAASDDLGTGWACDLFFLAEREYWQSRNHAGRVQYERQNRLGLGWANHDHHTFRSSRRAFPHLVATLEQLGYQCRERFYAGREAGWGAQVLEQPDCRMLIFADVDLSPAEVADDFAHSSLAKREELGTVGLWCELHGEAFLGAGMHHLEAQFDFDAVRSQLAAAGVETLAPFTDFAYLRQAFTHGETWPVDPQRVDRLLAAGHITDEQAERFRREGALGSHLEILERNDGYKGFNQTGISEIIARTDPRQMVGA